jgi:hypothetical protein
MATAPHKVFDEGVARALAVVGAAPTDPAIDALCDPMAAAAALDAKSQGAPLLLRAGPPLGEGSDAFGPDPAPPLWIGAAVGDAAVRVAPLMLERAGEAARARAKRVAIATRTGPCCDAASCSHTRTHVAAWLELLEPAPASIPGRLLVAESADLDEARALARVHAVAARLARALGIPLDDADPPAPEALPKGAAPALLPAGKLARHAMRTEEDRFVLRDHGSLGPRTTAGTKGAIGAALLVAALALWAQAARMFGQGDRNMTIGFAAAAALVTLAGYAFVGVARYSARYSARSAPLLWMGRDRFVIAPWVNRTGGVDRLPEGRLGAAIKLEELRGVSAQPRDGLTAVELDTDHGPMDALVTDDPQVASLWCEALRRTLAEVAHPSTRASARKRARERAAA